eukprot:7381558-Prymnesium_polylepis.1
MGGIPGTGDGGGTCGGFGGLGDGELGGGSGAGICSSPAWMIQLTIASFPLLRVRLCRERSERFST